PILAVIKLFIADLQRCEYLVAHNMSFDMNVVGAEMIRLGVTSPKKLEKICTMKTSTSFCGLPRNKWPKLEELHEKLFGEKFEDAHDALADVRACARCFFELLNRKVIYLRPVNLSSR